MDPRPFARSWVLLLTLLLALGACSQSGDDPERDAGDALQGGDSIPEATETVVGDAVADVADVEEVEVIDWLAGGPAANVFLSNPFTDNWIPTAVALRHLEDPDGLLTGTWVRASTCGGGQGSPIPIAGMSTCSQAQTVTPGEDGDYLHILPPDDASDPTDAFAEAQMYFHVDRAHDFFAEVMGATHMDWRMPATVNVRMNGEPFDNAAFMPEAQAAIFGIDVAEAEGAIVFGQGVTVDYSYDASVIYHEYTHAVIGGERLWGGAADEQGYNPQPGGINEATADYFAASILDDPLLGRYALYSEDLDHSRDLTELRHCPEDFLGEVHYDGRIWASALWAIRESMGAARADELIYAVTMRSGLTTTFAESSTMLIEEAARFSEASVVAVEEILLERGLIDCRRVKPLEPFDEPTPGEPVLLTGKLRASAEAFNQNVPMSFQYVVEPPEGALGLRLVIRVRPSSAMGWQAPFDLGAALRSGQEVAYSYPSGKPVAAADLVADLEHSGEPEGETRSYELTVAGACVTSGQPLYVHLHNRTVADGVMVGLAIDFITDEIPEGALSCD